MPAPACSSKSLIARESCAFVRGASYNEHKPLLFWWNDAPVFSREAFDDFFARLKWDRLSYWVFDSEVTCRI